MKSRPERFGALVAVESPPALVAVDRRLAAELGIEGGVLWDGPDPGLAVPVLEAPTEAHVAVTERCPAGCTGCYADATPTGHVPTFDELTARLDELAALGVFSVAFGGGEPALRDDIGAIAAHARAVGLAATMTTSGLGISAERARALTAFNQINVSWDGPAALYREVRGYDGSERAEQALGHLQDAGIPTGVNTVLTSTSFAHLDEIARGAESLGAMELQLLRFKPSGRGRLDYLARRLTPTQVDAFGDTLRRISRQTALAIRIDCALLPFLAQSAATTAGDLSRFAVMGCEAGRSLMTLDAQGAARPCSFWHETTDGTASAPAPAPEGAARAWRGDSTLERFRSYAADAPEPCTSCEFRQVCRGGCRIVAGYAGDPYAPDPECPRVRRFTASGRRSASSTADRGG